MSLTIVPFETFIAEALTGQIIRGGQGGNAAKIVSRANVALEVVQAAQAINTGNAAQGIALLTAAAAKADVDPAFGLAVSGAMTLIAQQAALVKNIADVTLLGQAADLIEANIASGVTNAANAEIAKYGTPAPAAAA